MKTFSDEELIDLFNRQLPDLLDRRPDLEPLIYQGFLGAFARREEVAVVLKELRELRTETDRRFEQVDQRFKQVDQRFDEVDARIDAFREEVNQRFEQVDQRFDEVSQAIDRLGSRWGIRNESVFRRTMAALLEESFGGFGRGARHCRRTIRRGHCRCRSAHPRRNRCQCGGLDPRAAGAQASPVHRGNRGGPGAGPTRHGGYL